MFIFSATVGVVFASTTRRHLRVAIQNDGYVCCRRPIRSTLAQFVHFFTVDEICIGAVPVKYHSPANTTLRPHVSLSFSVLCLQMKRITPNDILSAAYYPSLDDAVKRGAVTL